PCNGVNSPYLLSLVLAMTLTLPAMIPAPVDGMVTQLPLQSRTHAPGRPSTTERVSTPHCLTFSQGKRILLKAAQGPHPPQSPLMPTRQPVPLADRKVRVD